MNNFKRVCPSGNSMTTSFWECLGCGATIEQSGYCEHCFNAFQEAEWENYYDEEDRRWK